VKRATILLPDDLARALEREARRRQVSVSDVMRRALIAYFGRRPDQPRGLPFADLGNSGHRHTARDLEQILAEEWARDGRR